MCTLVPAQSITACLYTGCFLAGGCIYNNKSGKAYKVGLNKERIAHFLDEGMSQSLKIAIIHLVLVHLRDQTLLKKVRLYC